MSLERIVNVANGVRGSVGTISVSTADYNSLAAVTKSRKFRNLKPFSALRYQVPVPTLVEAVDQIELDSGFDNPEQENPEKEN